MHIKLLASRLSLAIIAAASMIAVSANRVAAQNVPLPTLGPPTSQVMQGYQAHVFRTFQVNISVLVPLDQLQSLLPVGFAAIAAPSGSNTAQIGITFIFHQRSERVDGVDGPASVLAVTALVRNSDPLHNRNETVLLCNEQSNATSVANANALFGEGTTRLAEIDTRIEERDGQLRFKFDATDKELRLKLKLQAIASMTSVTRINQDPVATPFRALNGTLSGRSFFATNRYDVATVAVTDDNLRVDAPDDVLHLPGGELKIVGINATMNVQRWRDNYFKLEGE